jgi:hypothetical protein
MRNAKDMKDMVSKARVSSNMLGVPNGVSDDPYDENYNTGSTLLDTSQSSKNFNSHHR